MKTFFKIILRLIAFPFVAVVILIAAIRNYLYTCWLWISNGGELTAHDDVFNPETMRDQFKKINLLLDERGVILNSNTPVHRDEPTTKQ